MRLIWIDHREARVFHFSPNEVETLVLHPDNPTRHIRHKANSIGSGHAATSPDYLQDVAESVADARPVLITGPANAKSELVEYVHLHDPRLTKVIAGAETVAIRPPRNSSLTQENLMATDRMLP
jgi:hypothetical protein